MEYTIITSHSPNHQQLAVAILHWCRHHPQMPPIPPPQRSPPDQRDDLGPVRPLFRPGQRGPAHRPPARPNPDQPRASSGPEYVVDADTRIRQLGDAGGQEQHFFHYYTNRLLVVNLSGHPQLYWRTITTDPGLSGREGALLGTESFPRGTVGYGVHASISLIRSTLGDVGQARIGAFFTQPQVQRLLARPDTAENNRRVAELEYQYWQGVRHNSSWGDWVGGTLGSQFNPSFRTYFPMYVTGPTRHAYDYTRDELIDPVTGYVTSKLNSLSDFATRRLQQLRERFPGL
ncbi:hypothetical protein [Fibrella forsythiae]|uniref:Uncharacterized protein n=1 Tax=Fibrella forsythiae TaxID=2817061 RepID=A0ABS3JT30_9BACT|nr:hypothetical protein [Fibrella forsythiae]MBO0953175.1 hypothetical protein [Fibrella forsythiae]